MRSMNGLATARWLVTACAVMMLSACGGGDDSSESSAQATTPPSPTVPSAPAPAPSPTPSPTPEPTPAPEPEPAPAPVTSPSVNAATLTWVAPTENVDGSALTDLAGFRIVYGNSPDALTQVVQISNPSISTYILENLPAGTHYFAVKAYNASGAESANSQIASKVIG